MWYNSDIMEARSFNWPVVAITIAVLAVVALAAYFAFRAPGPAPLIDPELAKSIKAEGQEVDRLYAEFQQKFPPEKLEAIQRAAEQQANKNQ